MALKTVLEEQSFEFTINESSAMYQVEGQMFTISHEVLYRVVWDGVEYDVEPKSLTLLSVCAPYLGNPSINSSDNYIDNGLPFIIVSFNVSNQVATTVFQTKDTSTTTHTVAIYEIPCKRTPVLENYIITSENTELDEDGLLVAGETYQVVLTAPIEDATLTVESVCRSILVPITSPDGTTISFVFLGNPTLFDGADSGELFSMIGYDGIGYDGIDYDGVTQLVMHDVIPTEDSPASISIYHLEPILEEKDFEYIPVISKKTLKGFVDGGYASSNIEELSFLTAGEKYMVYWDGILYNCVGTQVADGVWGIGNLSLFDPSLPNTEQPFVIGYIVESPSNTSGYMSTDLEATSHEVAIYRLEEKESLVVFEEQEVSGFEYDSDFGAYTTGAKRPAEFSLEAGKKYQVLWGEEEFVKESVSTPYPFDTRIDMVLLGNGRAIGLEDTGEPFSFAYVPSLDASMILSGSDASINIAISIYEEPDGVVIRNPRGKTIVYGDYPQLLINKVSGEKEIYSKGKSVDNLTVSLDLSNGDQTIYPVEKLFTQSTTIKKPDSLQPSNIVKDVEIAGVVGSVDVSKEDVVVDLNLASGDQVVTPSVAASLSSVTITKPDTLVAENIKSGVVIGGVEGILTQAQGVETSVELDFSNGDMEVIPEEETTFSKVTITQPETLVAENIAKDVDIAGVVGTLETGGGESNQDTAFLAWSQEAYELATTSPLSISAKIYLPVGSAVRAILGGKNAQASSRAYPFPIFTASISPTGLTQTIVDNYILYDLTATTSSTYKYKRLMTLLVIMFSVPGLRVVTGETETVLQASTNVLDLPYAINTGYGYGVNWSSYGITKADLSQSPITWIPSFFMDGNSTLTQVLLPESCSALGFGSFQGCTNLAFIKQGSGSSGDYDLYIPNVTELETQAINGCSLISSVYAPLVETTGYLTFGNCTSLREISLPSCIKCGGYTFRRCTNLVMANLPLLASGSTSYMFDSCVNLTTVSIPLITEIGSYCFRGCSSLTSLSLGDIASIGSYAFSNCTALVTLDLSQCTTVPTCSKTNAFDNVNSELQIKVPAALYDEWIAAEIWSDLADYIVAV